MENTLILFIYYIMDILPFIPLRYMPFMDRLRIPFWKIMAVCSFIALIQGISTIYISDMTWATEQRIWFFRLVFLFPFLLVSLLTIKDYLGKVMFYYCLVVPFGLIVARLDRLSAVIFFPEMYAQDHITIEVFLRLPVLIPCYIIFYFLMKRFMIPAGNISSGHAWKHMWFTPLILTIIALIVSIVFMPDASVQLLFVFMILILLGCIASCYTVLRVIQILEHNSFLEETLKTSDVLLDLQKKQYSQQEMYVENARKSQHDLRHIMNTIGNFISTHQYDKLASYVQEVTDLQPERSQKYFSNNYSVNSVLNEFSEKALKESINYEGFIDFPDEHINVSDVELSILFGNCIENSLEALIRIEKNNSSNLYIKFSSMVQGNYLFILIENPCVPDQLHWNSDSLLSSKRDYHSAGIGLSSVKHIAEKYSGNLSIKVEQSVFYVEIMLKLSSN